eukprot:230056-Heterocapsa_arctica.AAC.1
MEEWSMATVRILEGPKKEKGAVKEVQPTEPSVENMQTVVMQKDVPSQRTCLMAKGGKHITKDDIGEKCGEKTCITCNARDEDKGLKNMDFEING